MSTANRVPTPSRTRIATASTIATASATMQPIDRVSASWSLNGSPPARVSATRSGTAAANSHSAAGNPHVPAHMATAPTSHVQETSTANGCTTAGAVTATTKLSPTPTTRSRPRARPVTRARRPPERSTRIAAAVLAATANTVAPSTGPSPSVPLAAVNPMNTLMNAAIRYASGTRTQ